MPPTLLLTRPEAASRRFAASVGDIGLTIVIAPILRIVPVAHDAEALAAAAGLIFTSAHAVAVAGGGRGRRAICVGPGTAAAARAAGYDVTVGPGDGAGLAAMMGAMGIGPGAGWLHAHGTHRAVDLPVTGMVVYDPQAMPLGQEARALLSGAAPVIVALFSPRSALLLADAARGALGAAVAPVWTLSVSAAAQEAWHLPAARRMIAARPDANAMRSALETLVHAEHSG